MAIDGLDTARRCRQSRSPRTDSASQSLASRRFSRASEPEHWSGLTLQMDYPAFWWDEPPENNSQPYDEVLWLAGWAFAGAARLKVDVAVDGDPRTWRAKWGRARPDVAAAFPDEPSALYSGWGLLLPVREWESGNHSVTISVRDSRGRHRSAHRTVSIQRQARYHEWLNARRSQLPDADSAHRLKSWLDAPRFLIAVYTDAHRPPSGRVQDDEVQLTLQGARTQLYAAEATTTVDSVGSASAHRLSFARELLRARDERLHLVLVSAGNVLEPHALCALAWRATVSDPPDALYSDSDRLVEGQRRDPFFRPAWSPELSLNADYVGSLIALSPGACAALLDGGDIEADTPQDLLQQLSARGRRVDHIPDVLYSSSSTAERAAGYVRTKSPVIEHPHDVATPRVSIIIASTMRGGLLERCLRSIRRSTYKNYETVVIANGPSPAARLARTRLDPRTHLVRWSGGFNYSAINNHGARRSSGEYLLFLNDDTMIVTPDWMERLLRWARAPGVGIAGAQLWFPEGCLQMAGVGVMEGDTPAATLGAYCPTSPDAYHGLLSAVRNTSSVSGACMLVSRKTFNSVHGFDEGLQVELGDVDLCLRIQHAGLRAVIVPDAVVIHDERGSRGMRRYPRDHDRFRVRWADLIEAGDPYCNPNLSLLDTDQFSVVSRPRAIHRRRPPRIDPLPVAAGARPSPERFDPESMGGLIAAEHRLRYEWVTSLVRGKTVLDAACGAGYGAAACSAAGARAVVGVDGSDRALDEAERRHGATVTFRKADILALPFDGSTFDLVTSFETIEHVDDPERALDELRRVLKADGLLVMSTPNRLVYPPGNPFHLHEFTSDEFAQTLRRRFRNVQLYSQFSAAASLLIPASELAGELRATHVSAGDLQAGGEVYCVALASDAELPSLAPAAAFTRDLEREWLRENHDARAAEAQQAWEHVERIRKSPAPRSVSARVRQVRARYPRQKS